MQERVCDTTFFLSFVIYNYLLLSTTSILDGNEAFEEKIFIKEYPVPVLVSGKSNYAKYNSIIKIIWHL